MDIVQTFFDECITESTSDNVPRSELYQVFAKWCRENGVHYVMTADAFGKRVARKLNQPDRFKVRGQYVWKAISLSDFASNFLIT